MKKHSFKKCMIAVSLAAALVLTGCGSSGGGEVFASAGTGSSTGGSGSSGGGTGSTGMGLTGGTVPTTGGGGGTGGGSSTTGTGTTDGGSTDGGGTDGGTTGGTTTNFMKSVGTSPKSSISSVTNPSQVAVIGNRVYFLAGFGFENGISRLMSAPIVGTGANATLGPAVNVAASLDSNESDVLIFPFGLVAHNGDLYISVGCNPSATIFGNGKILKVSNLSVAGGGAVTGKFDNLTLGVTPPPTNPAFLFVASEGGQEYVYWSQYASTTAGAVCRISTSSVGTTEVIATGLNFPAGIATDGTHIVVAHAGNNQILRYPLGGGAQTIINPSDGSEIRLPFDVDYDEVSGFFVTQGMSLSTTLAPTADPLPIQYVASGSSTSRAAVNSVVRGAEIEAVSLGGGKVGLLYGDNPSAGRLMRAEITLPVTAAVTPNQISSFALALPYGVKVLDSNLPSFLTTVNITGGINNGSIDLYRP